MAKDYSNFTSEDILKIIEKQDKELANKKYGLVWDSEKEPEKVVQECAENLPILKNEKKKAIKTDDQQDNILIEGDNYHALTTLNYTHKEKVDIIYIDPPYNTGASKEWKYNDIWVDKEDGYRHSKWLNFMEKRLNLAKKLLTNKGVIFISIDDNEFSQLKLLCDKIFGENNFINSIIVRPANPVGLKMKNADKRIVRTKEFMLVYAKDYSKIRFDPLYVEYENFDHFNLFLDKKNSKNPKKWVVRRIKEVIAEKTKRNIRDITNSEIRSFSLENVDQIFCSSYIADRRDRKEFAKKSRENVLIYKNPDGSVMYMYKERVLFPLKSKLKEIDGKEVPASVLCDLWLHVKWDGIANEGGVKFANGKKPIKLIKDIIKLIKGNKNFTILDFFAGSGTTGHAVLDLNKEDGGSRNFIICTNNEDNNGDGNKICENICYPRIKNVIKGQKNKVPLEGNLQYFKTALLKKSNNRDQVKINLTHECTEMLCVKENIFNTQNESEDFKIFKSNKKDKFLCVYYNFMDKSFKDFLKEIKKLNGEKIIYQFSLENNIDKELFKGIDDIRFEAIPQKILEIYKQLVKLNIKK